MLLQAAKLFSENYGIWGPRGPRPGERVRFTRGRLREQCRPEGARNTYVRVKHNSEVVGHALAGRWTAEDGRMVCWVTQLVVKEGYRERGLATGLLRHLSEGSDDVYGIMSSHPATCLAAISAFMGTLDKCPWKALGVEELANQLQSPPSTSISNSFA